MTIPNWAGSKTIQNQQQRRFNSACKMYCSAVVLEFLYLTLKDFACLDRFLQTLIHATKTAIAIKSLNICCQYPRTSKFAYLFVSPRRPSKSELTSNVRYKLNTIQTTPITITTISKIFQKLLKYSILCLLISIISSMV